MKIHLKLFVIFVSLAFGCSSALTQSTAIVGGTVIDGNGGKPIEEGVILIEGKRIVAVGDKSTKIPQGAKTISAAGKYVMPGLMDANVHLVIDTEPLTLYRYEGRYDELAIEAAQIALKTGLTTVFDSWGPRRYLIKARDEINSGSVVGSRFYVAGNIVGLGGPMSDDFWKAYVKEPAIDAFAERVNPVWQDNVGPELLWMTPEQVREQIREYTHKGIDFLKYAATGHSHEQYIEFSPRVQQIIVEETHRAGIPVQTHTTNVEGLYLAIQNGLDMMQHCDISGQVPIPEETLNLIVKKRIPCAMLPDTDKVIAWRHRNPAATAEEKQQVKEYEVADQNERALIRAGAILLLSTDAGPMSEDMMNSPFEKDRPQDESLLTFGDGHFSWLLAVEQKGMKPMDALKAATINIARAYKVDKDLGTLEKGKIADLLILDKNPLERAANYRSISLVMKEGQVIDREALPTRKILTGPNPAQLN